MGPVKRFDADIKIKLSAELRAALEEASDRAGESAASVIRRALLEHLAAMGITVRPRPKPAEAKTKRARS